MGWLRKIIAQIKARFNKKEDVVIEKPKAYYPCTISGVFSTPSKEAAIAARNVSLIRKGFGIKPGENDDDNNSTNNRALGGGNPWGGIWLSGSFQFDIDANGQQIPGNSWIKIFSDETHPVTGGVTPDGKIGMGSVAGVSIKGEIKNRIAEICVSESGMDVTKSTKDTPNTLWDSLPEETKANINGNWWGDTVQYVHGNAKASWTLK